LRHDVVRTRSLDEYNNGDVLSRSEPGNAECDRRSAVVFHFYSPGVATCRWFGDLTDVSWQLIPGEATENDLEPKTRYVELASLHWSTMRVQTIVW